jgi:hypothetical protein
MGCILAASCAKAADLPPEASVLDPDIIWDVANPQSFAISPDGKLIAYISKGAIWSCSVDSGPPTKLADLPETITAFIVLPKYAKAKNKIANLAQVLHFPDFQELSGKLVHVVGLRWTRSQDGVVFALRRRWQSNAEVASHRVMHASLSGAVSEIATINRDVFAKPHSFDDFHVISDRTYVVALASGHPLIWNAKKSRAQVTPYDLLVPSSTSERFLGIEIDTRQLVLVDADFRILKRFDFRFESKRQCDLTWSADERFALCRRKEEYPSDKWVAHRIDLNTGEQRQFSGSHWTDQFEFTGRGGEFVQYGIVGVRYDYLDRMSGAYLTITPDGDGPPQDLIRFTQTPREGSLIALSERPYYPAVIHDPEFGLFAMALPRASKNHPGFLYHLIDRRGQQWPVTSDDESQYLAPAYLLAFANSGRTIVARNNSQLFSMPVSAMQSPQELGHD